MGSGEEFFDFFQGVALLFEGLDFLDAGEDFGGIEGVVRGGELGDGDEAFLSPVADGGHGFSGLLGDGTDLEGAARYALAPRRRLARL